MKRKSTARAPADATQMPSDVPQQPAPPGDTEEPAPAPAPAPAAAAIVSTTPAGIAIRLALPKSIPGFEHLHALVPAGAEALWLALQDGPVSLRQLETGACTSVSVDTARPVDIAAAFLLLARLWAWQAIAIGSSAVAPALEIRPAAQNDTLNLGVGNLQGTWRATRFASLRHERDATGQADIFIENPRTTITTHLAGEHAPRLAALFAQLLTARDTADLYAAEDGSHDGAGMTAEFLYLLAVAGVIEPTDEQGRLREDVDAVQRQWEYHDLLFHFRSRQGRHSHPMGAGFRFKGVLEPQPATKPNPWRDRAIPLTRPDLNLLAARDLPFGMVLEGRRSLRSHDSLRHISALQIGEFLYRAARVRGRQQTEIGELTSRPYPSGGASYELEIYLCVNQAADLARGFYYYDPAAHALCLVRAPDDEMEALLDDAFISAARSCRPQVLITLASRFQRVGWKYEGMAYAVQLKNVGVLYQTFYLVATAMNLAGCALGLGNAARFARLADTDYLVESSVGEFMLGIPG